MSDSHSYHNTDVRHCQELAKEDCDEVARMLRRGPAIPEVWQPGSNRAERRAIRSAERAMSEKLPCPPPHPTPDWAISRTGSKPWCGLWVCISYRRGEAYLTRLFCHQATCLICITRLQHFWLRVLQDRVPDGCWQQAIPLGNWGAIYKRLQRREISYLRVRNTNHAELLTVGKTWAAAATWLPPNQYENFLKEIIIPDADHVPFAKRITHSSLFNPEKKEKEPGWERIIAHKSLEFLKEKLRVEGLSSSSRHEGEVDEVVHVFAETPETTQRLDDFFHPWGASL